MGGGSSSESTSYGYLPYVTPGAASVIGQYQANAANQAAQVAQQQTAAAIAAITNNFNAANTTLQPYVSQGVQAQNELNRYLGLDPYNPGSAPTAPKAYTPSQTDIQNYVANNSYLGAVPGANDNNLYTIYNGLGAKWNGISLTGANGPYKPSGLDVIGYNGPADYSQVAASNFDANGNPIYAVGTQNAINDFIKKNPDVVSQISDYLTQQYNDTNKDAIQAANDQYQKQLEAYNQNLQWYNEAKAAGSYTPDQISAAVAAQPGYAAQQQQGIDAIQKAASAKGLLGSGNMLKDISNFGSQLESQYYNNMLNNLAQQAGIGAQAANSSAGVLTGQGTALGNLQSQLSDSLANAALAKGQAQASAYQLGNTQYNKVITGESSSSSGGGGLSGIGSLLGGVASLGKLSSKLLKTKGEEVKIDLDDLDNLPVEKWQYKPSVKFMDKVDHIGPYAEDFKEVFGVGDGVTIDTVDAIGVLFGIVKQLKDKIKELEVKNAN